MYQGKFVEIVLHGLKIKVNNNILEVPIYCVNVSQDGGGCVVLFDVPLHHTRGMDGLNVKKLR